VFCTHRYAISTHVEQIHELLKQQYYEIEACTYCTNSSKTLPVNPQTGIVGGLIK
jgi:hypothetical protein